MDLIGYVTDLKVESLLADLTTFITTRRKPRQALATFAGKEQAAAVEYDAMPIRTEDRARCFSTMRVARAAR